MNVLVKTSLGYDGIAMVTMNYCLNMPNDVSYTFFVVGDRRNVRDDFYNLICQHKWKIVYAPDSVKHFGAYRKALRKVLRSESFDVFHINGNSALMFIDTCICKKVSKNTKIIVHSHNSQSTNPVFHYILKPFFSFSKVNRLACSDKAGFWAFGKKQFIVLPNSVDYKKFYFDSSKRELMRKEIKVENRKVVLHVGGFVEQKNQLFLIPVIKKTINIDPSVLFVFVGKGPNEDEMKKKVLENGVCDNCLFLENRDDINHIYSMSDLFVLPSLYEGLAVVLIEAQLSGLPCIVSDHITDEASISNKIVKVPIDDNSIDEWVKVIVNTTVTSDRTFVGDMRFSIEKSLSTLLTVYGDSKR